MKLGYVSRVHPKDHYNHTMLTIQGYKPKEFAGQINLNVNNMWGILKVFFLHLPEVLCLKCTAVFLWILCKVMILTILKQN